MGLCAILFIRILRGDIATPEGLEPGDPIEKSDYKTFSIVLASLFAYLLSAQAHFAIDKIEASLESLGSKLSDVVRTRVYVNNMSDWEAVSRAHGERFADIRPANTMFIAKLIGDEYLVEIEAEAVIQ
jgi:hypothetical protein